MSENFDMGRFRAENQLVFLNTGKIMLTDIQIQSNFGAAPLNFIGQYLKLTSFLPNSEQYADVSINYSLINQDNFISLTGDIQPINMFILKTQSNINDNFCLISGYLNSYSAKYSIGQIPQISTNLRFYGNAGKINTSSLDSFSSNQLTQIQNNDYSNLTGVIVPDSGPSLNLTLNELQTNRVLSCDIGINCKKIPIYNAGARAPKKVNTIFPLDVNFSCTFEVGTYNQTQLRNFPQNKEIQNISLIVSDYNNGQNIAAYYFSGMNLVNETEGMSIDGNLTITKNYFGKLGQ